MIKSTAILTSKMMMEDFHKDIGLHQALRGIIFVKLVNDEVL